jgi:hypothetical protein
MAIFKRRTAAAQEPQPARSVVAAAVNIGEAGTAAWRARVSEDAWQKQAWHHFDACGELRYAVTWIANAVSQATMYAGEIDVHTGIVGSATDNPTVQAVVNSILGGPAKRAQAQATMALNWQVAGEFFTLVRPQKKNKSGDDWYVLSSTEVTERGSKFKYCDPMTGAQIDVMPQDLLMRVWSPHPRKQSHADSPVRAALSTLVEIEKTSANISSRLDSRLATAGWVYVPEEVGFPTGDGNVGDAQDLGEMLMRTAEVGISNPGTPGSHVPILVPIPSEMIPNAAAGKMEFGSDVSSEVISLRVEAMKRLAIALDMPAEIMLGMGDSNHWSAWQIEEAAYKIHVAPLLDRIADAFTTEYLVPALTGMGVADPERYALAFDVSDIITRPNRHEEMLQLYDRALISETAMLAESGLPDSSMPSEEERTRRLIEDMVKNAPSLLRDPAIREIIGIAPNVAVPADDGQPELPSGGQGDTGGSSATPERPTQAGESTQPSDGLVAAAELIVFDALSRAGGRLLTREYRGQYGSTPKVELHTVIPHHRDHTERLMEGSFQFVDNVAAAFSLSPVELRATLQAYVADRLQSGKPHDAAEMRSWLIR